MQVGGFFDKCALCMYVGFRWFAMGVSGPYVVHGPTQGAEFDRATV